MKRMMMVLATTTLVATMVGFLPTTVRADFDFPPPVSTFGLNLVGDAGPYASVLRLTPAVTNQAGAAWYSSKQYVGYGFESSFEFSISEMGGIVDENNHTGADGFAFVIQNSGANAIGAGAAGIGYPFIPNALAVEFDTWWNHSDLTGAPWVNDPSDNHIGVHVRVVSDDTALEANALASVTPSIDMSDGNVHTARIIYNPPVMKIFLDNMAVPVLTVSVDLGAWVTLDAGRAFVGFTSATGGAYENHDIVSWSFEESLFFGDIEALVSSGILNLGQGESLISKLEAALASLKAGEKDAACGQLQAYINQVKAFVKAGILTPQQAQQLSDHAFQVRNANDC